MEVVYESEPSSEEVVLDKLPLMDVIENGALLEALQNSMNGSARYFWPERWRKKILILWEQSLDCLIKGQRRFTTGRFRKLERALKEVTRDEF